MISKHIQKTIDLNSAQALIAANFLGSVAALTVVILPGIVGVIAESLQLSSTQVGLVASADLVTMAIFMAITALTMNRLNWRFLGALALVIMLMGTLFSIQSESYEAILIARFFSGIGEGIGLSIAFAILGGTRNPTREFGVYIIVSLSLAAILLNYIPTLLALGGSVYVFAFLGILIVTNMLVLPWIPVSNNIVQSNLDEPVIPSAYSLIALGFITVFLFHMGHGGAWAFFERIAWSAGLSGDDIGFDLAISSIGGITGAMCAVILNLRFGRAIPLTISAVISVTGLLLLLEELSVFNFGVAVILFGFAWNFSMAYLSGLMAELDPQGRTIVLMGAIQTAAIGLGPAAIAMLLTGNDFSTITYFSSGLILASLLFVLSLLFIKQKQLLPQ